MKLDNDCLKRGADVGAWVATGASLGDRERERFFLPPGDSATSSSGLGGDGDRSGESETTIDCLVGDADR